MTRRGKIYKNCGSIDPIIVRPINGRINYKKENLILPNYNFSEDKIDFNKFEASIPQDKHNLKKN